MAAKYFNDEDDTVKRMSTLIVSSKDENEEKQPTPYPTNQYTFEFTTGETLNISEDQLKQIPYLETLISNENDKKFATVCDAHGVYQLDARIEYKYLLPILASIPYTPMHLFSKLPICENVFKMLELYDFLCIESCAPSLEDKSTHETITDVKSCHSKRHGGVDEHIADRFSARNTAAEFTIGIARNEYNMRDHRTANKAYQLILFILSHPRTFRPCFRFHTVKIIDRCCQFSPNQNKNISHWKLAAQNIDSELESDEESDGSWNDEEWGEYD